MDMKPIWSIRYMVQPKRSSLNALALDAYILFILGLGDSWNHGNVKRGIEGEVGFDFRIAGILGLLYS